MFLLFACLCRGFLELCQRYKWFEKHRIEPSKTADPALVRKAFWEGLPKNFGTNLVAFWGMYALFKKLSFSRKLPSLFKVLWHSLLFFLINDTIFYWSHRMLHHRSLYGRIHKKHHDFKQSVGIAAEYAHPIEDVLNTIATFAGPALIKTHFVTYLVYLFIRIHETEDAHSMYNFPFSPWRYTHNAAERHGFHHSKNVGNYGIFPMWDSIMGTDKAFNKWLQQRRSKTNKAA